MIKKILIANRAEISLRIQRTAKKMGIGTVVVYASADRNAAFVNQADEAIQLEGESINDTYLNINQIITIAQQTRADAIHPGYGFLSENAAFVAACNKAGIIFIGPDAAAMNAMGNKIAARERATKAGVPVTPGITGSVSELRSNYQAIDFPILIKAAAGGGGKGMRIVSNQSELDAALEATSREANSYFGDDTIYIEKYIAAPRHIEVQILGDQQGNVLHLFERECSLQRRHQKIIEEAPSPTISSEVRENICKAAVQLAKSIGYYSAGTMEFLLDENHQFYFLEMNTRIQVEHPVTELTTEIDIVEQQINIANSHAIPFSQKDIRQNGHAIECRIYAEDPEQNFLPSPGTIKYYQEPQIFADKLSTQQSIRIDGMQLKTGDTITGEYDPMISKLIVWSPTREDARKTMLSALEEYHIKGIKNNILFLKGILRNPDYINNNINTKYIDNNLDIILNVIQQEKLQKAMTVPCIAAVTKSLTYSVGSQDANIWQSIGFWRHLKMIEIQSDSYTEKIEVLKIKNGRIFFKLKEAIYQAHLKPIHGINYELTINHSTYKVSVYESVPGAFEVGFDGSEFTVNRLDISNVDAQHFERKHQENADQESINAPMPGKVIKVNVAPGDVVKKGDLLMIVEAMKMENNITAPFDAAVEEVAVQPGDKVDTVKQLIKLKAIQTSA